MEPTGLAFLGAGIGAGIAIIGGGVGIGLLANGALQGISRQPQAAATIQTAMLIAAALIEGIAFLALVICFLLAIKT
jgi:F-type H+-transporting ATPase subunit c